MSIVPTTRPSWGSEVGVADSNAYPLPPAPSPGPNPLRPAGAVGRALSTIRRKPGLRLISTSRLSWLDCRSRAGRGQRAAGGSQCAARQTRQLPKLLAAAPYSVKGIEQWPLDRRKRSMARATAHAGAAVRTAEGERFFHRHGGSGERLGRAARAWTRQRSTRPWRPPDAASACLSASLFRRARHSVEETCRAISAMRIHRTLRAA